MKKLPNNHPKTFSTSESFWMGLQADYGLEEARTGLAAAFDQVQRLAA